MLFGIVANAQCPPTMLCPGNIVVGNDPGKCGAVVNFSAVGADTCLSGSRTFNFTGQIDTFTVPTGVGLITIEARGAQGGNWGGKGAIMIGDFTVTPGQQLKVLVGEMGEDGDTSGTAATDTTKRGGGGGGGSFVTDISNNPMCIAGGGGGRTGSGPQTTIDGRITTDGGDTYNNGGGNNGQGGMNGQTNGQAPGGGGLLTDGQDYNNSWGGKAFVNGGAGGLMDQGSTYPGGLGGFGGGAAGWHNNYNRSGGGGGYSGGQGGTWSGQYSGGGGGSFNNGTNQNNTPGANTTDGLVIISWTGGGPVTTTQLQGLPTGSTFPAGVTNQVFVASSSLGTDTCSFTVTVNDTNPPTVLQPFSVDTVCTTSGVLALPPGSPAGGTYSGPGIGAGNNFNPANAERGSHYIYYTDTVGCHKTDSTLIVVIWCTGIEEAEALGSAKVTPNPSNGIFNLTMDNENQDVIEIRALDITGRTVWEQRIADRKINQQIDLSGMSNGLYMLNIKSKGVARTMRLVKN